MPPRLTADWPCEGRKKGERERVFERFEMLLMLQTKYREEHYFVCNRKKYYQQRFL